MNYLLGFVNEQLSDISTFDETKDVLVSKGGNIFLYIKEQDYNAEEGAGNAAADTEENQAE